MALWTQVARQEVAVRYQEKKNHPLGSQTEEQVAQRGWRVSIFRDIQSLTRQGARRTCEQVGDPCWSSLFLKDYTPWKGPTLEQFLENFSPWERSILENSWRTVSCECDNMLEQKSVRSEQCQRERVMYSPQPPFAWAAWGKEIQDSGVKLSLLRREGGGKMFLDLFLFLILLLCLIGNKLNYFLWVCCAYDGNCSMISPSLTQSTGFL